MITVNVNHCYSIIITAVVSCLYGMQCLIVEMRNV